LLPFSPELFSHLLSEYLNIRIYEAIILPAVLYGCETWSLTLRQELRLRVFKDRALIKILVPKRDELMGMFRKPHNKELHDLYSSQNIIRIIKLRMRWLGLVAQMGRRRGWHMSYW
jgi:hypothetical protein